MFLEITFQKSRLITSSAKHKTHLCLYYYYYLF